MPGGDQRVRVSVRPQNVEVKNKTENNGDRKFQKVRKGIVIYASLQEMQKNVKTTASS